MKRKNKKIFTSLVSNYIVFVIMLIILLIVTIIFTALSMEKEVKKGHLPKLWASTLVKEDYENMDVSDIVAMNGWVEILDSDLNVIYINGDKVDEQMKYSKDEIFRMLNVTMDSESNYFSTIEAFSTKEKDIQYCLVKFPSNKVNIQFTFKDAPYGVFGMFYDTAMKAVILFLGLFILNILLFSRWTSRKISKPLEKITQGISKMTEGNYDTRLEFRAEKEFALIRDSFNYMAENLERTEKEKKEIEESKMRMISDLSHDIKTPLTTIQGYTKALSQGMLQDEGRKQRYYKAIYNKSIRVDELINDMLEFVKIENPQYTLEEKTDDFCEFIREIVAEHYEEIEEKGFDLVLKIPEQEIVLKFDTKLMSRAVSNIIVNALKYNPEGTNMRIEIIEGKEEILLEIADNGVGVSNDVKSKIFDPFVRGDKVRKSDGGTGLGLAISKNIIEKHGGNIGISSGKKGEATMFTIILKK